MDRRLGIGILWVLTVLGFYLGGSQSLGFGGILILAVLAAIFYGWAATAVQEELE
ncbi:MAG: hypothetical protein M1343_05710 [Chloroflexi bacterium]|nr:hypothetical protein [Chloroflexota bacterium]MDA8188474.1 hypothetical protein [Dehalococcoidales bacterium]